MPLLEIIHSLIKFLATWCLYVWFHSGNENLWRGCISNKLWQPFLFPRWRVWKYLCHYLFYSWEHEFLVNHKSKYRNKSPSFWIYYVTDLGHIYKSNGGIWFCDKTCVWKGYGICETTMYKICQLISLLHSCTIDSLPKIWWMHLGLCISNIDYNENLKSCLLFI
jgi:hypothetical protein